MTAANVRRGCPCGYDEVVGEAKRIRERYYIARNKRNILVKSVELTSRNDLQYASWTTVVNENVPVLVRIPIHEVTGLAIKGNKAPIGRNARAEAALICLPTANADTGSLLRLAVVDEYVVTLVRIPRH